MLTHRSVQHCRDKVLSNALHLKHNLFVTFLFRSNQNGAFRVHSNYLQQKDKSRIKTPGWVTFAWSLWCIQVNWWIWSMRNLICAGVSLNPRSQICFYKSLSLVGCVRLAFTLGHLSFNFRATPVSVPPVPAPATNMSNLPESRTFSPLN